MSLYQFYSCNNKAYIVDYNMGKLLIDLGTEERKLQGISSYKGVEDISISSCKELKAIRRWKKWVLIPVENRKL